MPRNPGLEAGIPLGFSAEISKNPASYPARLFPRMLRVFALARATFGTARSHGICSSPSAPAASHSDQSSPASAISRAVCSHVSLPASALGRSAISGLRSSSLLVADLSGLPPSLIGVQLISPGSRPYAVERSIHDVKPLVTRVILAQKKSRPTRRADEPGPCTKGWADGGLSAGGGKLHRSARYRGSPIEHERIYPHINNGNEERSHRELSGLFAHHAASRSSLPTQTKHRWPPKPAAARTCPSPNPTRNIQLPTFNSERSKLNVER